ncbi:hypothetical protein HYH03_006423 [Edaphochlamys debaryana]|uniref:Uncharacterized protein n=1 Tax=Edaphochlamys debaryana TaxID=47281 RepID=A0A836C1C9_9CHLO|nr:hypothetical protein HYH03_006423 [Edaphochlamys debaryana]|eukprot:KAG2495478.1 hypothetical protein HYH03_006423 [Edaphochlamys debaryana]
MFVREEAPQRTTKKQFGLDVSGKKDHMLGTHATVRSEYVDPPPKKKVPIEQLQQARNLETHYIKSKKIAEALKERETGSHIYAAGEGWGTDGR